jgi:hypothetical protein
MFFFKNIFKQPLFSQSEMTHATVAMFILAARLPTMDMYIRWIAIKLVHGVGSTRRTRKLYF